MGFRQKIRNIRDCRENSSIYGAYYAERIDENLIYFESRNGRDFAGNIFRVIEELSTGSYGDFKIHVFANPKVKLRIENLKERYNLKIDRIITTENEAAKTLERAKYIFTDSGIRYKYVKRDSQVFVNLWHGTPLKLMGIDYASEIPSLAHIQHPLLSSDYLLYPNEYMADIMLRAYQIDKVYPGRILLEGYPRNSVFFDDERRLDLKSELGFEGMEVFIYMPTYRGTVQKIDDKRDFIADFLSKVDEGLNDKQVLIAKLHPYDESNIDYGNFSHVIPFAKDFETYDVLNVCDVLITDYSSVLFDYANSKGKIVLFNYDEDEYLSSRGVYIPLEDLPFPKVQNVDDLLRVLNSPKDYDDTEFLDKFCRYDSIDATKNLCARIFTGEKTCREIGIVNQNPNVLIYPGNLDNCKTLFSMLSDDYNYFLTYKQWDAHFRQNLEKIVKIIPDNVRLLPFRSNLTPTFDEKRDYNKYLTSKDMECPESLERLFKRSFDRQYPNLDFTAIVDFDGTDADITSIFAHSNRNSIIRIHEATLERANTNVLRNALAKFNTIVAESSRMAEEVEKICSKNVKISSKIEDFF